MKKTFIRRLAAFAVMLSCLFGSIHPDELIVALASEYVGECEYKDSVSKKLTIKPPKLAAPTLSTKNSAIIVKRKKVTTYAVGYQIIYDKVESFDTSSANHTEDYHTTTVTDLNTLTKTLSAYTAATPSAADRGSSYRRRRCCFQAHLT